MTLPSVTDAEYPTPDEVLNQLLTNVKYAYDRIGVVASVAKGSELYERFKVLAGRISVAIANNKLALADISPLDATGDALVELAGTYGIFAREASSAQGFATVTTVGGSVTIPANFVCTSPTGIQYETITANTVVDGENVQLIALSAGEDTDADEGDILTWDDAAIGGLGQTCVVASGDISGGKDKDDEETLRSRLLRRLSSPSVGGNTAQVAEFAESSSAAVEKAFVYMAARGASTYDVAIVSDDNNRQVNDAIQATVSSFILGLMPGSARMNLTSVNGQQLDVVVNAALPLPVNAGGAGGGWRDDAPWPSSADGAVYAEITDVPVGQGGTLAANTIKVDSTAADPPVVGKRFALWDYENGQIHEFTIKTVGGAPGAYLVEIDTSSSSALSFVEVGMRCSAGASNLSAYAEEFQAAIKLLGPGEKTTSTNKLPQARRFPPPDVEAPSDLTAIQLTLIINEHPEILDMTYAARHETGTANVRNSPSVPATVADEPRILTLKHLSIRRQA